MRLEKSGVRLEKSLNLSGLPREEWAFWKRSESILERGLRKRGGFPTIIGPMRFRVSSQRRRGIPPVGSRQGAWETLGKRRRRKFAAISSQTLMKQGVVAEWSKAPVC